MKPSRHAPVSLLAAVLAAVLLAACSRPEPAPEPIRAVRTTRVTLATAQGELDYAAEIRARTESRLGFRVPGKMMRRHAELGQVVRAGQLLAQLDPQDLRLSQQAATAAVRAAEVSARQAEDDLERFRGLHAQGFVSAAELQRRESAAEAAQAQLRQAAAQSDVQRNQATYSELRAPSDGVVTAVDAEPGAVLAAGSPVLRLAHAGPRDAVFAVPEDAVAGVRALIGRAGALQVKLWGQERSLPATVREVAAAADPTTRTFQVKADLGRAQVDLGQTATVTLTLPPVDGVLKLPLSALLRQHGATSVWVLDPASMTVRAQTVEVAGADGNVVLIGGGLDGGAEVVTAGVHVLSEGQKVTRYTTTALPPEPAAAASAAARPASMATAR